MVYQQCAWFVNIVHMLAGFVRYNVWKIDEEEKK